MSTTPPTPPTAAPVATLLDLANVERTLRDDVSALARSTAAAMADPRTLEASQRPVAMGRRMGIVVAVNAGPPLTADVEVNAVVIPGASPQSTYRPQVDDLVWVEIMGPDVHISAPLTSEANRKWTNLVLSGGWSTFGGATPGYWRDPTGMVYLRGAMAGGANGVFASLPAGYRPTSDRMFSVPTSAGGVWNHSVLIVRATGNLEFSGPATVAGTFIDAGHFRID